MTDFDHTRQSVDEMLADVQQALMGDERWDSLREKLAECRLRVLRVKAILEEEL